MKREIINSDSEMRLVSHKGMISLRELQSQTGEEWDALSSSPSVTAQVPDVISGKDFLKK